MKRSVIRLLALGASLLTVAGCTPAADTPAPSPSGTTASTTETAPPTTPTTTAPTEPAPDPALFNRLTGEYDNPAGRNARPIAVMIGNNDRSRPQIGITAADMFVEAETEGGITRIMAVFSDVSRIPEQLCPIRSARSPFVLLAQSLDAVYVHAGGSKAGLQTLANANLADVDGLMNHGNTFWRDSELRAQKGLEYSLSTAGDKLGDRLGQLKTRLTSDRNLFTFGDSVSGDPCRGMTVVFSRSQTVSFAYDEASGLYTKQLGQLGGSVHKDAAGKAITARNVLVLYDTRYAENEQTISFRLSSGSGLLAADGVVREIQWIRTKEGLTVTEEGKPATFLPGKTYVCLVTKGNAGSTVIQ